MKNLAGNDEKRSTVSSAIAWSAKKKQSDFRDPKQGI